MSDPKGSNFAAKLERGYPKREGMREVVTMIKQRLGGLRTKAGGPELAMDKQGTGFLQGWVAACHSQGLGAEKRGAHRAYFNCQLQ